MKMKKKIDRSIGRVRRETRDLRGRKRTRVLIQFCQLSKTFLFLLLELPQCLKQQNEKKKKRASCNSSHFSTHWCSKHCVKHLTRKKIIIFVFFFVSPRLDRSCHSISIDEFSSSTCPPLPTEIILRPGHSLVNTFAPRQQQPQTQPQRMVFFHRWQMIVHGIPFQLIRSFSRRP